MPTKLTEIQFDRVDLVDVGANLDRATGDGAHVMLWKRGENDDMSESKKVDDTKTDAQLFDEALDDMAAVLSDVPAETVAKKGRKMSAERASKLKAIADQAQALLAEVEPAPVEKRDTKMPELDEIMKSNPALSKMFEDLKKRADDNEAAAAAAKADAEKAQAIAKAEQDKRIEAGFVEVAKSYKHLGIKHDEFGPVLKRACEALSADDYKVLETVLKAADEAAKPAFSAMGQSGQVVKGDFQRSTSSYEETNAFMDYVDSMVKKSDGKLSETDALVKAATEKPDLYAAHVQRLRQAR